MNLVSGCFLIILCCSPIICSHGAGLSADRFLRNMVRATVDTLLEIGYGKKEPSEMKIILDKRDRQEASMSAPGQGLFLFGVEY